jgi:hypothetical protein
MFGGENAKTLPVKQNDESEIMLLKHTKATSLRAQRGNPSWQASVHRLIKRPLACRATLAMTGVV